MKKVAETSSASSLATSIIIHTSDFAAGLASGSGIANSVWDLARDLTRGSTVKVTLRVARAGK